MNLIDPSGYQGDPWYGDPFTWNDTGSGSNWSGGVSINVSGGMVTGNPGTYAIGGANSPLQPGSSYNASTNQMPAMVAAARHPCHRRCSVASGIGLSRAFSRCGGLCPILGAPSTQLEMLW